MHLVALGAKTCNADFDRRLATQTLIYGAAAYQLNKYIVITTRLIEQNGRYLVLRLHFLHAPCSKIVVKYLNFSKTSQGLSHNTATNNKQVVLKRNHSSSHLCHCVALR